MPSKPWGNKQACPKCTAKFYDLGKRPASCPKCGHSFDPMALAKPRRAKAERKAAPEASPLAAAAALVEAKVRQDAKKTALVDDIDLGGFESIEPIEGEEDIEEIEEIDDMEAIEDIEAIDEKAEEGAMGDDITLEDADAVGAALIDTVEEDPVAESEDEEGVKKKAKKK